MFKNKKKPFIKEFFVLMMVLLIIMPTIAKTNRINSDDKSIIIFEKYIYGDFSGSVDFLNDKDVDAVKIDSNLVVNECIFNNNKTYYLDDYSVGEYAFITTNILEDNSYGTLDVDMYSNVSEITRIIVFLQLMNDDIDGKYFRLVVDVLGVKRISFNFDFDKFFVSMVSNGSIYIIVAGLIGILMSIIVAVRLSKVKNNALSNDENKTEETNRKKRQKKKE